MADNFNQIIEIEAVKLRDAVINAVNASKLPAAVSKMVLQNTVKDIVQIINTQIANERPQENGEE